MATSQNGYSANDRSVIASYTVPGTALRISLRKGDVSVVLLDYLRRYNAEIEPLTHTPQDLWGYAERLIRGSSTELSNHASGTACDCRATAHPLGVRNTFSAAKAVQLRALIHSYGGVLRWGGDYSGRVDEMHCEINAGPAAVKAVADRIRSGGAPPPSTTKDWFDMATQADLEASLHKVLGGVIYQTTGRLPNRRGPGGAQDKAQTDDTLWGFAMSADGSAYRVEKTLVSLQAALAQLHPAIENVTAAMKTLADFSTPELLDELGKRAGVTD